MKKILSAILLISVLLTMMLSLSSCAPYKNVESDVDVDYEELMVYFEGLEYMVDGYAISSWPASEDNPYYSVTVLSPKESISYHQYAMEIVFCGTHNGAVSYCERHLDERRTIFDELFEIIVGYKPYSKFAVYGKLAIMYNDAADYRALVNYIDSLDK